jgi:serine/threonine-protein kinase
MVRLDERYRLVERLGAGGMSVVWRAFDEVLGRQVAVKMLAGDYAANPDLRHGIRREARAAARLAHPNIGVVYDYGESRSPTGVVTPYVVMELIDGPSLGDRLRAGAMSWRDAVGVCAQVAAALGAAHARGLVHRDVKPANVMLSPAGVKVVDFGISALVGEVVDQTPDGQVLGTPAYVAPERLIGAPVGTAADVYALGVVLFKAVTGRPPWPVTDATELLAAHLTGEPDPLPPAEGLPAEVADLYRRCLAKDPGDRPPAAEAARVLAAAAGLIPAPVEPPVAAPAGSGPELTTLLPSSADTAPIAVAASARVRPGGRGTRPLPAGYRRRRAAAVLAVLPLTGVAAGLYATTTGDHHRDVAAASSDAPPPCAVTYQIGTDDGATFAGTLTLDAGRPAPTGGWSVSFDLPATDQTFRASAPGTSTQSGSRVVVRVTGTGRVAVPFTGSYHGTYPLPAAFVASGQSCAPTLIGPGGGRLPAPAQSTVDNQVGATGAAGPGAGGAGDKGDKGDGGKGKGKGRGGS